jgi:hypothetical protein
MSTIKISELPNYTTINANTANTLFCGVDIPTKQTVNFTAHTLAQGLFSNEILNVGVNPVSFDNTVAQFSGVDPSFLQTNFQNFNPTGSVDVVLSADIGTNETNFLDLGFNNSEFDNTDYTSMYPLDGYLYVQDDFLNNPGGNLVIGTAASNGRINFIAGGKNQANIVGYINSTGIHFTSITTQISAQVSANLAVAKSYTDDANVYNVVYTNTANNFLQANDLTTLTSAKSYTNTANTFNKSYTDSANTSMKSYVDTANTFNKSYTDSANTSMKSYVDTANTSLKSYSDNKFFANTSGTLNGSLTVSGALNVVGAVAMNTTLVLANSNFLATESAITINASNGTVATPSNDGYLLHLSGKQNVSSRIVSDSYGANAYSLIAGRGARGTVSSPSAVQTGDVMMRISGNGYGTTGYAPIGVGRIDFVATENYTDSARGSQIQFYNTRPGTNTLFQIASFNADDVYFTGTMHAANVIANGTISFTNVGATNINVGSGLIRYDSSVSNNTATQLVSKSTAVTSNGRTGQITTHNAQLAKGAAVSFTVNNNYITSAKDVVILSIASGATVNYAVSVNAVNAAGSFVVSLNNADGTAGGANASDALVINYAIIRVS